MKMISLSPIKRNRNILLLITFLLVLPVICQSPAAYAATAKEIEVSVDVALERFHKDVKGATEFSKVAKGLLILPNVVKAGFLVGGEYGEGALRIGGKTVDYYNIAAGSFGLQIGAQKKDIIIAFMTDESLDKFRAERE
jgi:lipid-binding SYLF domain-containing protein